MFSHWLKEDRAEAAKHLNIQKSLARTPANRLKLLQNTSYWYSAGGQQDSALYYNARAQAISPDPETLANILIAKSSIFLKQDQSDSARFYLRRALTLLPETAQPNRFSALNNLASSFQKTGQFDSAYIYIYKAFQTAEKALPANQPKQIALSNQLLGMYFFRTSVYDSALTYLLQAVDGFHVLENSYQESHALDAIGGVLLFQEKYEAALPYYKRAIAIAKATSSIENEAEFLHNTGIVFKNLGLNDSAKTYFREALALAKTQNQIRLQANCSGNLGGILLEEGDARAALSYLKNAEALFAEIHNPIGACLSRVGLGQCYQQLGDQKQALSYLHKAKRIADQLPILQIQKECVSALYEYYDQLPQADSALHYFVLYSEIKDSIQGTEVRTQIERLQIEYETRLKEEENLRLNAELNYEQEKYRLGRNRSAFIIGFVLLMLLAASATFYFRSKAKKLRILLLQEKLIGEERQSQLIKGKLETAQETIVQKNHLLIKLEDDLRSGSNLQQLADKLHERINTQGDWMQFMIEFELVHAGFFERFKKIVANPSPNDLRFAALMRLQLSNKEIAEVLLITPEGVKKAKNRLKKKLGLAAEDKLPLLIANL